MSYLLEKVRSLRHRFKEKLPYVRRREYRILKQKYESLANCLARGLIPANDASLFEIKTPSIDSESEFCLFVSFAAEPRLKNHVVDHINNLTRMGIKVILIVNTDLLPEEIYITPELSEKLNGIFIRENIGFDFAAWSHIYNNFIFDKNIKRLFLINDSIVGPLDIGNFEAMIYRIRASESQIIGLTEMLTPRRHLQSFFLTLNAEAIKHPLTRKILCNISNMATKSQVIDVYESNLTSIFEAEGFICEALFPSLSQDKYNSNDIILRWDDLIKRRFPYIKSSVIKSFPNDKHIQSLVPINYRNY